MSGLARANSQRCRSTAITTNTTITTTTTTNNNNNNTNTTTTSSSSSSTDRFPGVAAKGGEFDKLERYGHLVQPLSFEPYGRLGPESIKTLRNLALSGSTFFNNASGVPASNQYSRWRAELERTLVYEVADVVLLSLGHSGGVHAVRGRRRR